MKRSRPTRACELKFDHAGVDNVNDLGHAPRGRVS